MTKPAAATAPTPVITDMKLGLTVVPSLGGSYNKPTPQTAGFAGSPFASEIQAANPAVDRYMGVDIGVKGSGRFQKTGDFDWTVALGGVAGPGLFFVQGGAAYSFRNNWVDVAGALGYRTGNITSHWYGDIKLGSRFAPSRFELRPALGVRFPFAESGDYSTPSAIGLFSMDVLFKLDTP